MGPVFEAHKGAGWVCQRCNVQGDGPALIAWAELGEVPGEGDPRWRQVFERAASLGLCDGLDGAARPWTAPAPTAPRPPCYPPPVEVRSLIGACIPVEADAGAGAWVSGRLGAGHLAELGALAWALPVEVQAPGWARRGGRSWGAGGYRVILPMFDAGGTLRSVRARRLVAVAGEPKATAPVGFEVRGLILANPAGVRTLRGEVLPARVVIAEGDPAFLAWAVSHPDAAVFGVVSGSWTPGHAARLPVGVPVLIATDDDGKGDGYAAGVARTLPDGAQLARWRSPVARPDGTPADADEVMCAGVPLRFEDAEPCTPTASTTTPSTTPSTTTPSTPSTPSTSPAVASAARLTHVGPAPRPLPAALPAVEVAAVLDRFRPFASLTEAGPDARAAWFLDARGLSAATLDVAGGGAHRAGGRRAVPVLALAPALAPDGYPVADLPPWFRASGLRVCQILALACSPDGAPAAVFGLHIPPDVPEAEERGPDVDPDAVLFADQFARELMDGTAPAGALAVVTLGALSTAVLSCGAWEAVGQGSPCAVFGLPLSILPQLRAGRPPGALSRVAWPPDARVLIDAPDHLAAVIAAALPPGVSAVRRQDAA